MVNLRTVFHKAIVVAVSTVLLSACAGTGQSTATTVVEATAAIATTQSPQELTVMTHDSFAVSEAVVAEFEQAHNAKLRFVLSGDSGSALNRAILSKDAPTADVFYGVDNTYLSRALAADLFEPYASPRLADIAPEFKLDAENRALPVDYGDVCINYDRAWFAQKNLAVPQSLEELTQPEYRGLLVVQNPATSSPGMAFLLATIAHFGEDGYIDYWKALRANDVVVVNDWETTYYTNFSGSSGQGAQPMALSYGSSPAAEVYFAETPPQEAPTASILGADTCFRQIEFVGILKGTKHRALAEQWVDFMLDKSFQEDMPLQMFVFPVNGTAVLPEVFTKNVEIPQQPARLDMDTIAQKRDQWIKAWDAAVLR